MSGDPVSGPARWVRALAATSVVAAAVAIVVLQRDVRELEAATSSALVSSIGLDGGRIGTAVMFQLEGRWVGYALSAGCSVAYILAPLYLVIAGLLGAARLTVRRGLGCFVLLTALLFTVNQARFAVIGLSMRQWGFETGYERSHIFLGTFISTIGVVFGLLIVVSFMTRGPRDVRHG